MEREQQFRVVYQGGLWLVLDRAGHRLSDPLSTQEDGVVRAKLLARDAGSADIVVEDDRGRVVSEFVYQREERPSLERDDASYDSYAATRTVERSSRPSHA